jgi:hypothetical protein
MPSFQVVVLVAGAAFNGGNSVSIGTAPHIHGVPVAVITLPWKIPARVAVHASRVMKHRHD